MIYWYDRTGKVIANSADPHEKHMADIQEVEKLLRDPEYKVISQDFTPRLKYQVSTVWLGIDHDYHRSALDEPNPNPIIFESMVFKQGKRGEDVTQERYSTEKDAAIGHAKLLKEWTDYEYQQSARGHIMKALRVFWSTDWSWRQLHLYTFIGAWIASFATWFLPSNGNHTGQLIALDAFVWGALVIYSLFTFIHIRRLNKKIKAEQLELTIRSIILETFMEIQGDDEGRERLAKRRKDFLNKL